MKLLVDNQLPVALARFLSDEGLECEHVQDIGMDASSDREIWDYAKAGSRVIVTKDEDFAVMADRQPDIPPQVVWVRMGNCRKTALLDAFSNHLPALRQLLSEGRGVIEIR